MRRKRIIRSAPLRLALPLLAATGCQPFAPPLAPNTVPQVAAPLTTATPTFVEPIPVPEGVPFYIAPGAPVVIQPQPSVVLPPTAIGAAPGVVPGAGVSPTGPTGLLPGGEGPISPAFGLPTAPVVENRLPNPLVVPVASNELAWDQLADVLSDYFPISREQPVQNLGGVLTEGFLETPFQTGATIFEPQRNDSVGRFNRWESTLQSIRRRAVVNVQPVAGGYSVRVNVIKQLEDLPQPEQALAGAAVLRNDAALPTERRGDVRLASSAESWIDLGRDEPLEQELLRRIRDRLASPSAPTATRPAF